MSTEVHLTQAREGDGHYYAKGHDWLLLCPHLGSSEKVTLMILCGLAQDGNQRNLTLTEIGDMLISGPVAVGETPKRMSVSGVAKVLNRLSEMGQLTDPQGVPIRLSNRMTSMLKLMPYRLPKHPCEASRNVYDELARVRGEDPKWPLASEDAHESERPQRRAYKSVRDAHYSVRDAHDSVPNAQNSVQNKPLTSENAAFLGSSSVPSSASSSSACAQERDAAPPEAPLEEDEEFESKDMTPSAEPRGALPQEREDESYAENEPDGPSDGFGGIPEWLMTLPGLSGPQAPPCGFLEYPVMEALRAGWTFDTLKAHLKPLVNPDLARNRNAIPGWYDKHLSSLPAPPKAVTPLCDNPAHAKNPKEDPVKGGCFFCNTQAAAGILEGTSIQPEPVTDTVDALTARDLCRRAVANRAFNEKEPSRTQMPHHRALDEAERNRNSANRLLRTER